MLFYTGRSDNAIKNRWNCINAAKFREQVATQSLIKSKQVDAEVMNAQSMLLSIFIECTIDVVVYL